MSDQVVLPAQLICQICNRAEHDIAVLNLDTNVAVCMACFDLRRREHDLTLAQGQKVCIALKYVGKPITIGKLELIQ